MLEENSNDLVSTKWLQCGIFNYRKILILGVEDSDAELIWVLKWYS